MSKYKAQLASNNINEYSDGNGSSDHLIPLEAESDSKPQNMSKYIKKVYRPFEYKNNKLEVKVKAKYFYPDQVSNESNINIQGDTTANLEYNEAKMVNLYQENLKKAENQHKQRTESYEKAFVVTNCTSNQVEGARRFDNKTQSYVKTQNNQELSKLLISSCSSSMSRKPKKRSKALSKSTNPFSSQDKIQ